MAGPNLEVFKFGCYVFFPILTMLKFGDPEWYDSYVKPYKEVIWPPYESTHRPPKTSSELHKELERLQMERQARRTRIRNTATASSVTSSGLSLSSPANDEMAAAERIPTPGSSPSTSTPSRPFPSEERLV